MRHYLDQGRVRRLAAISRVLSFGGMGVMLIGLVVSFRQTARLDAVLGLFLAGMIASQLGIPMRNRWDRHPRIDEVLDRALKGLDDRFAVFHYWLGANHAVIAPGGVFALVPRFEDGQVRFKDGRWSRIVPRRGRLRPGGTRRVEGLERQAAGEVERLQRRLNRRIDSDSVPTVQPLLVFLHSSAELQVDGAPIQVTHIKKLKDALRRMPRGRTLTESQIAQLSATFARG